MSTPASAATSNADSIENRYYAYLRGHGYSSTSALIDVLRVYLPLFDGHDRVADLGCGHGEFLALLQRDGHTVSGVDIDPAMVAACRAQGFDVAQGDAETWLAAQPGALDGVFSSNVIEHLPAAMVARWIVAAHRALRAGGRIVLATPNPESLIVQFHEFWRDPTHVRLYSRQLLEFMLADAGFVQVTSHANPASAWDGADAIAASLEALPPPPQPAPPASAPLLPEAPGPGASARERWAWRVASLAYRKFTEPFLLPLREEIERHRQILRELVDAAAAERENLAVLRQRMTEANRFLYPPREIYVTGVKPDPAAALPQG